MTRQSEGNVKEIVDHLVDYAAEDCGTRARPALLLNAARLITSQAAEIERLREAALRVLAWVAPIAGDNMDEAKARKEIESVQSLVALVGPVTSARRHYDMATAFLSALEATPPAPVTTECDYALTRDELAAAAADVSLSDAAVRYLCIARKGVIPPEVTQWAAAIAKAEGRS